MYIFSEYLPTFDAINDSDLDYRIEQLESYQNRTSRQHSIENHTNTLNQYKINSPSLDKHPYS